MPTVIVASGLGGDPAVAIGLSGRSPGRPGDGNTSLVVGGGDPVAERRRLLAGVGLRLGRGVAMEQVHGAAVALVDAADAGTGMTDHAGAVPGVDALVTFSTDVALVVMTADCVPVLLADGGRGVAAVHAGRRGVVAGVVPAAVDALASDPARVDAFVGPAIGACCYEVPQEMAENIAAAHPAARATTSAGTFGLDLPAAVEQQLRTAGVRSVTVAGECTSCGSARWFSHRVHPGSGRQAAVIARRSLPLDQPDDARPWTAAAAATGLHGDRDVAGRPAPHTGRADGGRTDGGLTDGGRTDGGLTDGGRALPTAPERERGPAFLHWRR